MRIWQIQVSLGLLLFVIFTDTSRAALTAFAVPSAASTSTWTSLDSGWTGPFNLLNDPFVTYQTVATPTGLRWQQWGSTDTSVFPNVLHGASAGRKLLEEMVQGQTFDFGMDARTGILRLGNIYPNNTTMATGFDFGPGPLNYAYSDNNGSLIDTGIANAIPIDVKITWTNSSTQTYTGAVTLIGTSSPAFTWTGNFRGTTGPDLSDLSNHINGFQTTNLGGSSDYFGLNYIEVGSGVLPDPSTLVPEPELVAFFSLIVAGLIRRRR